MSLRILKVIYLLTLFGCSSSREMGQNFSAISNICYDNIHFPKVSLRIETNGQLRSHRLSLTFFSDSLIHSAISSGFNRQVASVIFDSRGMQFYDLYSKSGFFISANEFKEEFGISNFPKSIKYILLGYSDGSSIILNPNGPQDSLSVSTSTFYDKTISKVNSIHIESVISDNIIAARYLWFKKSNNVIPQSTYITVKLKDDVYEFDLEFDHKSFTTSSPPIALEEDFFDLLTNYTLKND